MGKEVDLRSLTVHFFAFSLYFVSSMIFIVFEFLVSAREKKYQAINGNPNWARLHTADYQSISVLIKAKSYTQIVSEVVLTTGQIILALIIMKLQSLVHTRREKLRSNRLNKVIMHQNLEKPVDKAKVGSVQDDDMFSESTQSFKDDTESLRGTIPQDVPLG